MHHHSFLKRFLFFLLGLIGLLAVICSIAATSITNGSLYQQGFQRYASTRHLGVYYQQYGDYAHALSAYLDGKTDVPRIKNPDTGEMTNAFSDMENDHLSDVRGIVTALKTVRYAGGGLVIILLGLLYFLQPQERPSLLYSVFRGFAMAAVFLLAAATGLAIWGAFNFEGLFWTFHLVAFSNNLWLMNPATDLLVALMPLSFFTWYAGELSKSLLPVLGIMLALIVLWLRYGKQEALAQETKKEAKST